MKVEIKSFVLLEEGKYFLLYILSMIMVTMCGCAMYIPTPEHGIAGGRGEIIDEELSQVEIAKTSREEILLKFGEPAACLRNEKILVYSWSTAEGYFIIGGHFQGAGAVHSQEYQVVFEFNGDGILVDYDKFELSGFKATGKLFSVARPSLPKNKSIIHFFRPWSIIGGYSTTPVLVDNIHLTDLQNGGFASVIVEPGEHMVHLGAHILNPKRTAPIIYESYVVILHKIIRIRTEPNQETFVQLVPGSSGYYFAPEPKILTEEKAIKTIVKTKKSAVYFTPALLDFF